MIFRWSANYKRVRFAVSDGGIKQRESRQFPSKEAADVSLARKTRRILTDKIFKKHHMKKTELKIILAVAIVFVAFNIVWFAWSHIKYGKLSSGMEENVFSTFVTPRYFYTDADGNDYLVKYPDYLTFTGNMSVGMPTTDENYNTDSLIIWPTLSGKYEFGVILYEEEGKGYRVYIDPNGNALSKEYEDVVSRHTENIKKLLMKADNKWGIYD